MPNPVSWFEIIGQDVVQLRQFYADVFGWNLGAPMKDLGNYSLLDNAGQGIDGGIGEGEPRVTVYIEVDDPQAYLDKAVQAGATMLMPVSTVTEGVTIGLFADPAGNVTGLTKARVS